MTAQPPRAAFMPASLFGQADCQEICQAHGGALIAVAQLVLNDSHDVCEVVAEAITAECGPLRTLEPGSTAMRQRLARSVFNRCRGRLVSRERFGEPAGTDPSLGELPSALGRLKEDVRAVVALTIFGRHGLAEAAAVLNVSPQIVLVRLREALSSVSDANGAALTSRAEIPQQSTRDNRRRPSGPGPRPRFADADTHRRPSPTPLVWVSDWSTAEDIA